MLQIPAESQTVIGQVAPAPDHSKSTLGYAYLRMLASAASFGCTLIGRHSDGCGVDVLVHVRERLDTQARGSEFQLEFQLRATSRGLPIVDNKLLFALEADRYETLRSAVAERPRFVVLLALPTELDGGDPLSAEDLLARRCGRWLCLSGAPQAPSTATASVRFPTWNVLTPAALREIARRVSLGTRFFHEQ
jgi:hypothetical protein